MKKIFQYYKKTFLLSFSIAKANFKLRNEGSYLGIFWYLLNPLSLFAILLFLRGAFFSTEHIKFYPIYLLIGIIMINFFNQLIGFSINVIQNNSGYIKSIKISQEVFVFAMVIQFIFSHIFELMLVAILFVFFKVSLIGILLYLFIFIFFTIFVLGLCLIFAVIGLYINDFNNIWSIASQLLFFITPIFYSISPGTNLSAINHFNPLFHFITITRDVAIYGIFPPLPIILLMIGISVGSFFVGSIIFNKFKGKFAELV